MHSMIHAIKHFARISLLAAALSALGCSADEALQDCSQYPGPQCSASPPADCKNITTTVTDDAATNPEFVAWCGQAGSNVTCAGNSEYYMGFYPEGGEVTANTGCIVHVLGLDAVVHLCGGLAYSEADPITVPAGKTSVTFGQTTLDNNCGG